MKSLTSWLTTMFLAMFWIFRVILTISVQNGAANDFGGFIVFNDTFEIVMLFVSILSFVLIIRRMVIGGIIYLVGYGWYFGSYLISTAIPSLTSGEAIDMGVAQNAFIAVLGILLGIVATLNIVLEKSKSKHDSNDKTNWFFDNKDYDRKMDDRADKNQYRTL